MRATKIHRGVCEQGPRRWIAALLVVVAALSGCGPRGPQRFQIEGAVTCDGKPVPSGTIRFEPDSTKGNRGPVGYAAIIDGRYATATEGSKGSLRGPLVAILTGGPARDPKVEFPTMWFTEYRTTLTLEPKSGVTTFDFDVPKETPKPK